MFCYDIILTNIYLFIIYLELLSNWKMGTGVSYTVTVSVISSEQCVVPVVAVLETLASGRDL